MREKRWKRLALTGLAAALSAQPFAASVFPVLAVESEQDVQVIRASDFGVDPYGLKDSTRAIQDALEACRQLEESGQPVRLEFEAGTYQVYKDFAEVREYHTSNTNSANYPMKSFGILVEDHENLTIEGNGALFMMHGNMCALGVVRSKNITLQNFAWDFAVPTTSEMTVLDFGEENGKPYTDFYIPKCFPYTVNGNSITWTSENSPYTGDLYWSESGIHRAYCTTWHDPDLENTRRMGTGAESPFYGSSSMRQVEGTDGTVLRVTYSSSRPSIQKKGMVVELNSSQVRETAGAFTWESENIHAKGIDVHYMHGFGWLIQMSKDVYYEGCSIRPRENSGHYTASYADGLHVSGASGEVVVDNCDFSEMHDDPINFHGTFTRVEQRQNDHTLTLKYIHAQQGGFPQYHKGDKVSFFTRDTLESTDNETQYTVKNVVSQPGDDGNDLKTMVVEFEEELPASLSDKIGSEPKYVAENVSYTPNVTIRNSRFQNLAARAILCTTRGKVLIENNTIFNTGMPTIYLSNDSDTWYESGPIRDMTIRNNDLYILDTGASTNRPAVYINPVTKGGTLPSWENPIHKNITIEGNTFHMDGEMVVKAESVENLTIRNNRIERTSPDLSLNMGEAITLPGKTAADLSADVEAKVRDGANEGLYSFKACKNVVVENNSYDQGQIMSAVYSNMPESQVSLKDAGISLSTGALPAVSEKCGPVYFASVDPSIAWVSADGKLHGENAGTTSVYAWTENNGSIIRSNPVSVTVSPEGAGDLTIDGDGLLYAEAADGPITLKANADNVIWSVEDPFGPAMPAAAIDENGVLTVTGDGLVRVIAASEEARAEKLVVCHRGIIDGLNPAFELRRQDPEKISIEPESVTITMQAGDLYNDNNTLKNLVLYDLPETVDENEFYAIVHVDGLPVRESSQWDTASFLLLQDEDNYISIGKKSHYDGIAAVLEKNGSATEMGADSAQNDLSSGWLGFHKTGDSVSLDFRTEDNTWQTVRTLDASGLTSLKLGLGAWHSNDRGKMASFDGLRVSSDVDGYEALEALESIPFAGVGNQAPSVSSASFDSEKAVIGQPVGITADFEDPDGDGMRAMVYLFRLEKEDGSIDETLVTSASYTPASAGELSCLVIPVDSNGMYGKPVSAGSIPVTAGESQGHILQISINDLPVDLSDENPSVKIPAEMTKARLNVLTDGAAWTVNGKPAGADHVVTLDSGSLTIATEKESVTIELQKMDDSRCALDSLSVPELGFEADVNEKAYLLVTDKPEITLNAASENAGEISIIRDFDLKEFGRASADSLSCKAALQNGLNTFRVDVKAKDGLRSERRILNVVYTPSSALDDAVVSMKETDGTWTPVEMKDDAALIRLKNSSALHLSVETEQAQSVQWLINDSTVVEGKTLDLSGIDEPADIKLILNAKDGLTKRTLSIQAVPIKNTTAAVESITLDDTPVADTDQTLFVSDQPAALNVKAIDERSVIIISDGHTATSGIGQASYSLDPVKGHETVTVTVTSYDGSQKTVREFDIQQGLWLSDLSWNSDSTIGWGSIGKDCEVSESGIGNSLDLFDENGAKVAYDKGIGTHADSLISFSLPEGVSFKRLEGALGLPHSLKNSSYANMTMEVLLDDQSAFKKEGIGAGVPMAEFALDLDGVSKISLKATQPSNNWEAHANFCGLRLVMDGKDKAADAVDLKALEEALALLEKVDQTKADTEKFNVFAQAVADGHALYNSTRNGETISQRQVDEAEAAIRQAHADLTPVQEADKTALKAAIQRAEDFNRTQKPAAAGEKLKAIFENTLKDAKALDDDKAAVQSSVDDAVNAIDSVISRIETVLERQSDLKALSIQAKELSEKLYPVNVRNELKAAAKVADDLDADMDGFEDGRYESIKARLNAAIAAADRLLETEALESMIAQAEKLDLDGYISNGKEDFSKVLKQAKTVLASPETQDQIDSASLALDQAMKALVARPTAAQRKALEDQLDAAKALDPKDYKEESAAALQSWIEKAQDALKDPELDGAKAETLAEEGKTVLASLVKADKPVDPGKDPNKPDNPDDPNKPDNPDDPNKDPNKPDNPDDPNKPDNPDDPDKNPGKPADPGKKPDVPSKDDTPKKDPGQSDGTGSKAPSKNTVKTGLSLAGYGLSAGAAALGALFTLIGKQKKNRK